MQEYRRRKKAEGNSEWKQSAVGGQKEWGVIWGCLNRGLVSEISGFGLWDWVMAVNKESGIGVPSYKRKNRAYKALPQEGSLLQRESRESEFPPTEEGLTENPRRVPTTFQIFCKYYRNIQSY